MNTKEIKPEAIKALEKTRSQLVIENIFFGNLVLKAKTSLTHSIPTAATNGKDYLVNPDFWLDLTTGERKFVLAHEVLHKAFLHHLRRKDRDPRLWNIAADYAINPILKNAKMEMPEKCLFDPQFDGMSAEQIYTILEQKPEEQPQPPDQPQTGNGDPKEETQPDPTAADSGDGQDPGNQDGEAGQGEYQPGSEEWDIGGVEDCPIDQNNPEQSQEIAEQEAKQELQEAATLAEMAGNLPGEIKRQIDSICEPIVNWKAELSDYMVERTEDDYSFRVRNRRYSGSVIMPGTDSEAMADMIFIVDTSGSVSEKQIRQFASEIMYFNDDLQPTRLIVLGVDTRVASAQEFEQGELVSVDQLQIKGGGGTRFQPAFDWIEENETDPDIVVYLTDGDCWDSPTDPGYPVLWALTEKKKKFDLGFGQVIYCPISR